MVLKKLIVPAAAIVAIVGMLALMAIAVIQSVTVRDQSSIIATLSANNDLLREQVQDAGEIPVAPPAETVVGAQGSPGPAGAAGADGRDGTSVISVTCGSNGQWVVLYSTGRVQTEVGSCVGTSGTNGADGAPGAPGAPGATGPAGSPGEPPTAWTFDWLGFTYSCTRTDPFDASAPTYECETV